MHGILLSLVYDVYVEENYRYLFESGSFVLFFLVIAKKNVSLHLDILYD